MPVHLAIRRNNTRRESQPFQFEQVHSIHTSSEKIVEDFVITRERPKHAPSIHPAGPHLIIVIFRPAHITAELLVCPAITDPVPTLEAYRHLP